MTEDKKIAVVCNKLAGGGRSVPLSLQIVTTLREKKISATLFADNWPADFLSFSDVWIVGGDGTLNFFINKYPGIQIPLMVFNGGTGNDVFSLLYKEKNFEQLVETGLNASLKPIDAGKCNEKYFINGVGIGFEGSVAKSLSGKQKTKPGKAAFMGTILRKVFLYRSKKYKIISEENNSEQFQLLISIMNGHRAGGGFHIAPTSAIDDGLLDVIMVEKLHPFKRLRWLPVIEKGKHLELPFIKHYRTKKIIVISEEKMDAHLDGEYYSAKRYEIEMMPARFLFRV